MTLLRPSFFVMIVGAGIVIGAEGIAGLIVGPAAAFVTGGGF
jgi:hypothetical protein